MFIHEIGEYSCECRYLWSPEDGVKSPGVEVTGGHEPNVSSFPCV